jgi:hypothetical protein
VEQRPADLGNHGPSRHLEFHFSGDDQGLSDVLAALQRGGFRVIQFREAGHDLEDVFLRVTQGLVT